MEKETIQKDAEILLRDFMERAQYAKSEMCREEAMSDNPALLVVVFEPKQEGYEGNWESLAEGCAEMGLSKTYQCGMIPLIHKPDPAECLVDVVGSLPVDNFAFMFVIVEGYRDTEISTKEEFAKKMGDYERGDMAKEFAENPFSTVTEVLTVHGYDWNLTNRFVMFSDYKYNDRGIPEFSEFISDHSEVGDDDERVRIDEILYRAVQFMRLNTKAGNYFEKWDKNPKNLRKRGHKE